MRSENYIIQLQNENKTLQLKNEILDTALLNACQSICRELNFKQGEIEKLKQMFINRVKNNYEPNEVKFAREYIYEWVGEFKEFKVGDEITPTEDCMGNFHLNCKYEITGETDNDFIIDDVAQIYKKEVYKYFVKVE